MHLDSRATTSTQTSAAIIALVVPIGINSHHKYTFRPFGKRLSIPYGVFPALSLLARNLSFIVLLGGISVEEIFIELNNLILDCCNKGFFRTLIRQIFVEFLAKEGNRLFNGFTGR